jgi:hypothetical protein
MIFRLQPARSAHCVFEKSTTEMVWFCESCGLEGEFRTSDSSKCGWGGKLKMLMAFFYLF